MGLEQIATLTAQVGFPIAITIYLIWRQDKLLVKLGANQQALVANQAKMQELLEALHKGLDQHQEHEEQALKSIEKLLTLTTQRQEIWEERWQAEGRMLRK